SKREEEDPHRSVQHEENAQWEGEAAAKRKTEEDARDRAEEEGERKAEEAAKKLAPKPAPSAKAALAEEEETSRPRGTRPAGGAIKRGDVQVPASARTKTDAAKRRA